MQRIDTVIVGAGQAGIAASRCLTDAGRDHVVLERGRLGERWRSQRWDGLHLLTPNWMTRLPGWSYQGADPDGFMAVPELVRFFEDYAASFGAPIVEESPVRALRAAGDGYRVDTEQGSWWARHVIVATGVEGRPRLPSCAGDLDPSIHQLPSSWFRRPDDLPAGGVLVVGASSSGLQLADLLAASGRDVVLASSRHQRVPRTYRGIDIFKWLEAIGHLDKTVDDVPDARRASRAPSLQLVGGVPARQLDLGTVQQRGVRIVGRLEAFAGSRACFGTELATCVDASERKMHDVLDRVDRLIVERDLSGVVGDPDRPGSIPVPAPIESIDLRAAGITSVVWATGFARSYPWLHVPVLDADGEIIHRRGATPAPGLYVLGLRFQHFRSSNFIDGVGRDARYVVDHIVGAGARRSVHEEVAA